MELTADFLINTLHNDWVDIMRSEPIYTELCECLNKVNTDINGDLTQLKPNHNNIFNAFKYTPFSKIRAVIIGQDPYFSSSRGLLNAHGLSFSTPLENNFVPPSLKNIYAALYNCGYIKEIPSHGCLINWATQGVLMLNIYLTTKTAPKQHTMWAKFTHNILKYISDNKEHPVSIVMWGAEAQKNKKYIDTKKHIILKWRHPSPLANIRVKGSTEHFEFCDHFTRINQHLANTGESINWDVNNDIIIPNNSQIITCFTDGACPNNGNENAKASFGVYFPPTFNNKPNLITGKLNGIIPNDKHIPTNNRGELTAIIKALEIITKSKIIAPILIVSDSEYCINIINEHIWNWNNIESRPNHDLLSQLIQLLQLIKTNANINHVINPVSRDNRTAKIKQHDLNWEGITLIHQRSHTSYQMTENLLQELWEGNKEADLLASSSF